MTIPTQECAHVTLSLRKERLSLHSLPTWQEPPVGPSSFIRQSRPSHRRSFPRYSLLFHTSSYFSSSPHDHHLLIFSSSSPSFVRASCDNLASLAPFPGTRNPPKIFARPNTSTSTSNSTRASNHHHPSHRGPHSQITPRQWPIRRAMGDASSIGVYSI